MEIVTDTTRESIREMDFFYPSGSLRVRGMLTYPVDAYPVYPLMVLNHGGVEGIYAGLKAVAYDLSSNHGYMVLAPSYRGEDGSEGEVEIARGEVDDVMNGLKMLYETSFVSKKQVYMVGASHGALITLIAMAKDKDGMIKKGVWAYGIADIFAWWDFMKKKEMLDTFEIAREFYPDDPSDDMEFFNVRNGLNYINNVKAPLLILHGDDDWLVPVEQAHMLKKAFDEIGKRDVKLVTFPRGDHGMLTDRVALPDGRQVKTDVCKRVWIEIHEFINSPIH